jgi:pimeloyl-ACP methyl ester carboxylesterase
LHEEIMFGLRELALGEEKWRLVSLSGGPPAQWEGQVYADANGIRIVTNLGEQVQLREGRIVRIDVEASDLLIAAVEDVVWPEWTVRGPRKLDYAPPPGAAFTRNEVELPGKPGEPVLYGEVLVPTRGKRPFAGVLFVSGTGQEDRHGFAGPPSVDLGSHEITDALANAGFMVMRFDERGRGKSEAGEISFLGQVEDARRALRTLLVQDGLDPDRIVVVGHGEGGVRALHVAIAQPSAVLGVALLAAPGRAYREVFLHQAEVTLEGLPPEVRSEARVQQKRMLEALERGEAPPELEPQAQWMREMLRQKPGDLIASVDAPLWIAQGGKDFEVDPQADVAALVRAAKQAKKEHEVHRYAELDHLFKLEPETSSPSRYLETDRRVDVGFIADLTAWAKKVVAQR